MKNIMESKKLRKTICCMLSFLVIAGFLPGIAARAATTSCKSLCGTALKAGGSKNMEYQSDSANDFGGLPASARKKIKSIQYVFDAKEVFAICVIQAKNNAGAKSLKKQLDQYKKNNCNSDYLQDYTPTEQAVFNSAICGRKGKYVWYIAMSSEKNVNMEVQKAIKNKL